MISLDIMYILHFKIDLFIYLFFESDILFFFNFNIYKCYLFIYYFFITLQIIASFIKLLPILL